jgi:anti-sigma regulatory factor (Ser/Thr protein kinase)
VIIVVLEPQPDVSRTSARRGVLAERSDGAVMIEVSDSGRWRAPRGSQRGLGLGIIEKLMDTMEVEQTPTGTLVRMRKEPVEG